MPSPFPGMDPFLEGRAFWPGLHHRLIFCIAEALNVSLPPGLAADIGERLYVVEAERSIYPDVTVVRRRPETRRREATGETAQREAVVSHGVLTAYPFEMREGFVEVRTTNAARKLVTIIEVLSPANKAAGSEGRQEYLQKQREILRSETHLLEIDLLRSGTHTVAAPLDGLQSRGRWDYLMCLHRSTQRYHYEYWMNHVREPLPAVLVPLTPGEPDVPLDLQAVLNRAYDSGRYVLLVDYRAEPPTPLGDEDAQWIDTLLRQRGLRG